MPKQRKPRINAASQYTPFVHSTIPVANPHPHDVLCGRGGTSNNHHGNSVFRTVVGRNKPLYRTCPKHHKVVVAKAIVQAVKQQEPPGRFLAKQGKDGMWYEIPYKKAVEKTSQALREKDREATGEKDSSSDEEGKKEGLQGEEKKEKDEDKKEEETKKQQGDRKRKKPTPDTAEVASQKPAPQAADPSARLSPEEGGPSSVGPAPAGPIKAGAAPFKAMSANDQSNDDLQSAPSTKKSRLLQTSGAEKQSWIIGPKPKPDSSSLGSRIATEPTRQPEPTPVATAGQANSNKAASSKLRRSAFPPQVSRIEAGRKLPPIKAGAGFVIPTTLSVIGGNTAVAGPEPSSKQQTQQQQGPLSFWSRVTSLGIPVPEVKAHAPPPAAPPVGGHATGAGRALHHPPLASAVATPLSSVLHSPSIRKAPTADPHPPPPPSGLARPPTVTFTASTATGPPAITTAHAMGRPLASSHPHTGGTVIPPTAAATGPVPLPPPPSITAIPAQQQQPPTPQLRQLSSGMLLGNIFPERSLPRPAAESGPQPAPPVAAQQPPLLPTVPPPPPHAIHPTPPSANLQHHHHPSPVVVPPPPATRRVTSLFTRFTRGASRMLGGGSGDGGGEMHDETHQLLSMELMKDPLMQDDGEDFGRIRSHGADDDGAAAPPAGAVKAEETGSASASSSDGSGDGAATVPIVDGEDAAAAPSLSSSVSLTSPIRQTTTAFFQYFLHGVGEKGSRHSGEDAMKDEPIPQTKDDDDGKFDDAEISVVGVGVEETPPPHPPAESGVKGEEDRSVEEDLDDASAAHKSDAVAAAAVSSAVPPPNLSPATSLRSEISGFFLRLASSRPTDLLSQLSITNLSNLTSLSSMPSMPKRGSSKSWILGLNSGVSGGTLAGTGDDGPIVSDGNDAESRRLSLMDDFEETEEEDRLRRGISL